MVAPRIGRYDRETRPSHERLQDLWLEQLTGLKLTLDEGSKIGSYQAQQLTLLCDVGIAELQNCQNDVEYLRHDPRTAPHPDAVAWLEQLLTIVQTHQPFDQAFIDRGHRIEHELDKCRKRIVFYRQARFLLGGLYAPETR